MAEFGNTFVNQTDLKMHLILFSEKKTPQTSSNHTFKK